MIRAARLVIMCTVAALATLAAQEPSQQPPTFRGRASLVRVDATVTDRHGDVVTTLNASDFEVAMEKLRTTLARFIAHHGASGYNETLTRFWLIQIEKRIDRTACLQESVRRVKAELGRKEMIYEFYSREKLNSPEAKQGWVEPDLKIW